MMVGDNMEDISVMLSNQRKYRNLKLNINSIITNLNKAIESLEIPSDRIGNYYNIDNISIDKGKLKNLRQDLINKKNYLENVVLVEINNQLNELSNNIESM